MAIEPAPLLDLRQFHLDRRTPAGTRRLLDGLNLRLDPGTWTVLLGRNGSGKSSLLKFIAGEHSPARVPVAYLAQDPDEQLVAGTVAGELRLGRGDEAVAEGTSACQLAGLDDLDPRLLSAGQKQRLALAVATGTGCRLLLADEPTALQDPGQAAWVLDRLDSWRHAPGRALLSATCDRREAARADRLVVLAAGGIRLQGDRQEVWDDPVVQDLLLDPEATPVQKAAVPTGNLSGAPLLRVEGAGCRFTGPGEGFGGIDLEVRPGERVGLTGPNGCGKSTLLAACAGLRPLDEGRILLGDAVVSGADQMDPGHGRAMLAPQFPEYLFLRPSVAAELAVGRPEAGPGPEALLAALGLPPEILARNPHDLSTGQRRRLAVGAALRCGRPLVLLDEPTAALDRWGRQAILDLVNQAAADGGLVVASHDLGFLAAAGCRILRMEPGQMGLAGPEGGC